MDEWEGVGHSIDGIQYRHANPKNRESRLGGVCQNLSGGGGTLNGEK